MPKEPSFDYYLDQEIEEHMRDELFDQLPGEEEEEEDYGERVMITRRVRVALPEANVRLMGRALDCGDPECSVCKGDSDG